MDNPKIIPIETVGEGRYESPLKAKRQRFYANEGIALYNRIKDISTYNTVDDVEFLELAGARDNIFFNPRETTLGIVTCGGLCPGLNDVIRAITFCALEEYEVKRVLGFQYGFEGLVAKYYSQPLELNMDNTDEIHEKGGTILKSSRGFQEPSECVDTLQHYKVNILFAIGGDGTLRGARDIHDEIQRRKLQIAVVGIPKTVDNDISILERSFGYQTAVEAAWEVVNNAHSEARAYRNGVGLVKLMGRHSGWISTSTALANSNVNFCLIPEVPFDLDGPNGFLEHLSKRLEIKDHAVVVVAEGAGQDFFKEEHNGRDKSGNIQFHDIGIFLRDRIISYFKAKNKEVNMKYFDPGYIIRSRPASATDSEYCLRLGYNAMHAGMAGKTNMLVGMHHNRIVHFPIPMTGQRKTVEPGGWIWQSVLQATHQPPDMINHNKQGS